jgi:polyferredoxin
VFSDRPLYPHYVQQPRLGSLSPLDDQAAAGVLMWVPGSLAYLVPLFAIGVRLMFARPTRQARPRTDRLSVAPSAIGRLALPIVERPSFRASHPSFDLLQVPVLGRFLRWKHSRVALQVPLAVAAGLVVYDGLRGPSVAAMNLAGVLPWIHWRGLLIIGMLIAGNVFCMACPFTLPQRLARRWLPEHRDWPRWLRNKWLALVLLVIFLWAYEACALWDSPWWTACIVLAYFAAAFAIDGFFRGGTFCKYVCPIGQFNFIQSLLSPLEVKVRDPSVCASCRTKECIRGSEDVPGCELQLYQPRKAGNVDCTFCLDCIHACPHQNVGILAVRPGEELSRDLIRSGIGRFRRRYDLAVLAVVLVFAAFVNAAGMTGPVVAWQSRLASAAPAFDSRTVTFACYLAALVAVPLAAVALAAIASRKLSGLTESWQETAARYSWALVPLGCSMWLTHYSFHFVTSYATVVPVTQRFVADLGWTILGSPRWSCACCTPTPSWLLRMEIVALDLGLLFSLYVAYRIATAECQRLAPALRALAPWGVLIGLLFAAGIWIVFQPMQMRGTMPLAG